MIRYVAIRPKSYDDGLYEAEMSITVHEAECAPVATGLLSADGTPLYRIEDRAALGFQPNRWKS